MSHECEYKSCSLTISWQ